MKKQLLFLAVIFCSVSLFAQVGNGIELQIAQDYQFSPTTTDSTSSVTITIYNTVASDQEITFTGLDAPFYMSDTAIIVGPNDSSSFVLSFTPSSSGIFSDTLQFSGNIFGDGALNISGEGVQVIIELGTDTLTLNTVALGNSVSDDIWIYNTGTGTMLVSDIASDDSTVTVSPTSFNIEEGGSAIISVTHTPVLAGNTSAILTIFSNDPDNSIYDVTINGNAVSNISGELCGTLSLINSPYTLTGDVTVAENCTLTIEAGVEIYGFGYGIYIDGTLNAIGTASDSIKIMVNELFLRNATGHDSLNYISTTYEGTYVEGFEEDNYTNNWNGDFSYMSKSEYYSKDGSQGMRFYAENNDKEFILNPYTCEDAMLSINWQYRNTESDNSCYVRFNYRINGGSWVELKSSGNSSDTWYDESYDISSEITTGDLVEFMVKCDIANSSSNSNSQSVYVDNIAFNKGLSRMEIANEEDVYLSNSNIISQELILSGKQGRAGFEDNQLPEGWTSTGNNSYNGVSFSSSCAYNSNYGMQVRATNYDSNQYAESDYYVANSTVMPISFDYKGSVETSCNISVQYHVNSESWNNIVYVNQYGSTPWTHVTENLNLNIGDSVQFRIRARRQNSTNLTTYDNAFIHFDNFYVMNGYGTTNITNSTINSSIFSFQNLVVDNSTVTSNTGDLLRTYGNVSINNSFLNGNNQCDNGIFSDVGNRDIKLFNSTIKDFTNNGIYTIASDAKVFLQYSLIIDNSQKGIYTSGGGSHVYLNSSMVSGNRIGIQAASQVNLNYSNITFNEDDGIYLTGNNFSTIKNSIIWGNDFQNYTQINTSSGVTSISYSTVQGIGAYGTSGSQYYFGDGSIDDDPVFEDNDQHMSTFSNCVDAGAPWESDANMPYGLGGVRADIGIYGGPENWFWGGTAVPDGAVNISSVEDKPQDQGGNVGVVFDASVWDNADLVNNVTSYAVWRHFDPEGDLIDTVSQGSWELVAEMPAQSFESYAITAESLGDSTILNGEFNTCFVVVAKTDDDDVFWYSNVACGYSTDDIAPLYPVGMLGSYNFDDGLRLSWEFPTEDDYLETNIYQDGVLVGTTSDNNFYDESADAGSIYDYTLEHLDSSGNPSDQGALEVSALLPDWNPVITSKTHHIAAPRNFSISTTNDPVERGDFLGVFYNNSGVLECGGMVQWSDQDVVLTAFGDSEEMSGFNTNETFVWRFWDASKNEYYFADVTYDSSLPNDANFIEDGLSALQSIEIYAKQDISLNQGWSMVSSYVLEDDLLMSSLMAPVTEDIVIMKDENGMAYWPYYNSNQIGDLSDEKGYKLLMEQSHQITFSGRKVIPNEKVLNLQQGWQIIPYLRESSGSVDAVFEDISESIIIVKDDLGQVYWPEWGINSIGNMNPGEGYQIKMHDNINFNYQANAIEMPLEMRMQDLEPEYFNVSNITESNMTIGIPLDAWEILPNVMDEIAVCDLQDRVMGSAVFNGDNMVISVWANDEQGSMKTGLNEGEFFQIKHRDMSNNASYVLKTSAWQQGSNEFFEDEIAIVSWIEQGELIDQGFKVYPVVPNPSTSEAQIQLFSPQSEIVLIELYNILGELVYQKELNTQEGMSLHTLPSSMFANGAYELKVKSADYIDVQSIQILK